MQADALSFLSADQWRIYGTLPDAAKNEIDRRIAVVGPCLGVKGGQCHALHTAARRAGVSFSTAHRWMMALKTGDLHRLIEKRFAPALWVREASNALLPAADIALWKSYALRYQRDGGMAAAYRQLIRDWRAGKVSTTQALDVKRGHPMGWSRHNLGRHKPDDYSLAAMRGGKARASNFRPQVLTTRVGLRCGQYLVGDDVWHDHLVHWRGQRTPVRPVEASVIDLAPGYLCQWGLRPRLTRADGTRENLSEREVRWIVAATLRGYGYRADELGTTWLVEHGTFALRDNVAKPLLDAFGIRVETSSILGEKAWLGAYGAKGGGNPRFKTWLESLHNLRHNEMSGLPGQVGKDRDHKPEELAGLVRYAERTADAEQHLALVAPHLAERIKKPVQTYTEFVELCDRVYRDINERRDHRLEGWREAGNEIVQYLVGSQLLDEGQFLALPPPPGVEIATWGRSFAERGLTKTRLLSPAEAAAKGRHELSPLPAYGVSLILGQDLAIEQTVKAGEFCWQDAELGAGELRYFAEITTPEGRRELLRNGEKYLVHANPFLLDELCVSNAAGAFLGVARRHERANRADREAMQAQYKAIAEHEAKLMDQLATDAAPILRERMGLREANAATLREALHNPERGQAMAQHAADKKDAAAVQRATKRAADGLTEEDRAAFLAPAEPKAEAEEFAADDRQSLADYL